MTIDGPDRAAYEAGHDPFSWSQGKVAGIILTHLQDGVPPEYDGDLNGYLVVLAGRILAGLLDAGWIPPEDAEETIDE